MENNYMKVLVVEVLSVKKNWSLDDKRIRGKGKIHHPHGLKARVEITRKSRCAF